MDIVYWWGVTMSLFEDDPNLIRRQERQVREQAERARAMRQRIESVQGVGVSPDSSVEIIVDSAGTLLGIGIAAARRNAGEQVIAASQEAFGPQYTGIERIRSLYGIPEPDDPADDDSTLLVRRRRPWG